MYQLTELLMFLLLILPATYAWSEIPQGIEWPQEVSFAEGKIIIYQPQPKELKGNT